MTYTPITTGLDVVDLPRDTMHYSGLHSLVKTSPNVTDNGVSIATQVDKAQANPDNGRKNVRMSKYGYPEIGQPQFVGYDQRAIDLELPSGQRRGLVFEPDDIARRFKVTFFEITNGLHWTYDALIDPNNIRAFVTYAVPDGLERLMAPRPGIYNAHGRRML